MPLLAVAVAIDRTGVGLPCCMRSMLTDPVKSWLRQLIENVWPVSQTSPPSGRVISTYWLALFEACTVLPSDPRLTKFPFGIGSIAKAEVASPRSIAGEFGLTGLSTSVCGSNAGSPETISITGVSDPVKSP